jgi:3-hydroxyacyl-CoA dehydrogenase/enoyl-CoA hydratase/3-hydroxybutyryl-CoA epimerase
LARTRGHQPALLAAVDVIEQGIALPMAEALEVEARSFGTVTIGPVCRNLVRVFFLWVAEKKRTLDAWFDRESERPPAPARIRKVGVVGAGVMGSGIAHSLALHGFEVVLRDVKSEYLAHGLAVIRGLFDESVKRGKADAADARSAVQRVTTTTTWEGFGHCDLVIEAIVEQADAKRALFSELASIVREETLLASNTSALPIEEIAGHIVNPARTLGIHFFNPVSRMPLVELIVAEPTSAENAQRALDLVKQLGKSAVICRSSPGFLVTRLLFFYLNEAVLLWEGGAGTSEIDPALQDFGWPMGPLRLIDEVGIDVTDFIFGELAHYFPSRFTRSNACARLLAAGLRGRKNGASRGFYRYDGKNAVLNDDEVRPFFAPSESSTRRSDQPPREITAHLMRVMVDEANRCLAEGVVKSPDDVDFALLSGAGFPAFRGGLMHWANRGAASEAPADEKFSVES